MPLVREMPFRKQQRPTTILSHRSTSNSSHPWSVPAAHTSIQYSTRTLGDHGYLSHALFYRRNGAILLSAQRAS
eukprot:347241-Chlamydomonas_euryale.AAC.5